MTMSMRILIGGRTYFNVKYETIGFSLKIFKNIFNQRSLRRICLFSNYFKEVLKDFEYLLNKVKELKKYADAKEQCVISALMANYISHYTKAVWMLNQQSA